MTNRKFYLHLTGLYFFNFLAFVELLQNMLITKLVRFIIRIVLKFLRSCARILVGGNRCSLLASWRMNLHPAVPLTQAQYDDITKFKAPDHFKSRVKTL